MQILTIHTNKMRGFGLLSGDVDIKELAAETKNYSGAELEGLVRAAQSTAMNRHIKVSPPAGQSGLSVSQSVGRLTSRPDGCLVGSSDSQSVGCPVSQLAGQSVVWFVSQSVSQSVSLSVNPVHATALNYLI